MFRISELVFSIFETLINGKRIRCFYGLAGGRLLQQLASSREEETDRDDEEGDGRRQMSLSFKS